MNIKPFEAQNLAEVEYILRPDGRHSPFIVAAANLETDYTPLGCCRIYFLNRNQYLDFELMQIAESLGEGIAQTVGFVIATLPRKNITKSIAVIDDMEMYKGYQDAAFRKVFINRLLDVPLFLNTSVCFAFTVAAIFPAEAANRAQTKKLRGYLKNNGYRVGYEGSEMVATKLLIPQSRFYEGEVGVERSLNVKSS